MCENVKSPTQADIRIGDIRDIFIINEDGNQVYEGPATLINPAPSRYNTTPLPYVKYTCAACGNIVNWTSTRWLVEFADGFRTHRYIHYFHSIGDYENDPKEAGDDEEE